MFCAACGAETVELFNYCKRCGSSVSGSESIRPATKTPTTLTLAFLVAITAVFLAGIGLPLASAHDLITDGFLPRDLILIFLVDMILTVSVICLLGWTYTRFLKANLSKNELNRSKTPVLDVVKPQLEARPESIVTVTENTTRTLEGRRYETPRSL